MTPNIYAADMKPIISKANRITLFPYLIMYLAVLLTHMVTHGVGVRVSNPRHFPLTGAHVRSGDIDTRP